ncbi:MAG: DUF5685 family protein [Oscillospiraceae bacterium]|jgi:hypothetical protein|nr:DUF5685 family protein [Oscillospiraceae bacterium]
MYGYIKPLKAELKVKHWELYQAAYCGLCHRLKERYGFAGRFCVNYDLTFLTMLYASVIPNSAPNAERLRCPANGRKKAHCFAGAASDTAADLTLILAIEKLRDGLRDDSLPKRLFADFPALAILRSKTKRLPKIHEKFTLSAKKALDELTILEQNSNSGGSQLDRAADTFAGLLSAAADYAESEENRRILANLLYHIGRVIYICDAADDLDEDRRRGTYNPLIAYPEDKTALKRSLEHSAGIAAADFELLPESEFTPILQNILYLGIPQQITDIS